jgi:hypothetical protein
MKHPKSEIPRRHLAGAVNHIPVWSDAPNYEDWIQALGIDDNDENYGAWFEAFGGELDAD